jgi:hypothetical protein
MKAAELRAQYRPPKLAAVASASLNGRDFATLLERAINASGKAREVKQIEARAIDLTSEKSRWIPLCHDRFTPRSSACRHYFDWERGPTEEERYEKEVQEEIEGNVNNWNARKVRLSVRLPREKHKKKSGPLTGPLRYCTEVGMSSRSKPTRSPQIDQSFFFWSLWVPSQRSKTISAMKLSSPKAPRKIPSVSMSTLARQAEEASLMMRFQWLARFA